MGEQRTIRLLIANEHQVIREGLRAMLIGNSEIEMVGSATNIQETIRLVGELEPDVLLLDPHLPNQDGLHAIKLIHGEWPWVAIIAFTIHQREDHILSALRAGVSAYLTLDTEQAILCHAIHAAAKGQILLQPEHIAHLLASTQVPAPVRDEPVANKDKDRQAGRTQADRARMSGVARGRARRAQQRDRGSSVYQRTNREIPPGKYLFQAGRRFSRLGRRRRHSTRHPLTPKVTPLVFIMNKSRKEGALLEPIPNNAPSFL